MKGRLLSLQPTGLLRVMQPHTKIPPKLWTRGECTPNNTVPLLQLNIVCAIRHFGRNKFRIYEY
jgi:hypothetical protein